MNIKILYVRGDSDSIVSQVKKYFSTKNPRLKKYRNVAWDAIKNFDGFLIEAIPRERNYMVDSFDGSASTLQLCEEIFSYKVEVNFRPSIPENL